VAVYRRLGDVTEPERFAGWISRIAVNKAVESLRRRARRGMSALDAVPEDPVAAPTEDRLERSEELTRMHAHVAELDERTQIVLVLRFREGLAVKDIAEQVGENPPAVSMRITRGLRKLRARMEAGQP
jgi:RNA polymerase sigma factor (sigma-70 family)